MPINTQQAILPNINTEQIRIMWTNPSLFISISHSHPR
uniref:Uncharacterized protein n=1 Tax=Arundo donax TaxID=35708 RepID=A0A0A8ZS00_ARUDO